MGMFSVAVLLLSSAQAQKPPTIDPTYGMKLPKLKAVTTKRAKDADWIWTATTSDEEVAYFRHALQVSKIPKAAKLSVTADNFFNAYVNGQEVSSSHYDANDNLVWAKVRTVDITSLLKPGENEITVKAINAGGSAGMILRLELDGKPVLLSDGTWKVTNNAPAEGWLGNAFDDSKWENATIEATAGEGVWGGQLSGWPVPLSSAAAYLAHLKLPPISVSDATLPRAWKPATEAITFQRPSGTVKPWTVVIDFGKELSGRVALLAAKPIPVKLGTGESDFEAIEKPWTSADLILDPKPKYSVYTALRYAALTFPADLAEASVKVSMDHLYYPVQYRGSFDCSDPLFTKVWYTGVYTSHLCMQEDIWDAPKRDRARWMGDLHVSGEVINNAFLDKFLMEQTMDRLRDEAQGHRPETELPAGHVNGIPGYSCAWIAGVADFYRHTGDTVWLKKQHQRLITMLEFLKTELNSDGAFANNHKQWPFVDWAPLFNEQTPQALAATHLFLVKATKEAVFLFKELGDSENTTKYQELADALTKTAQSQLVDGDGTFGGRRQENAMAIYSGVATPTQVKTIYEKVLDPKSPAWDYVVSPYYGNYVLDAITQSGHMLDAMKYVRTFWGGMLAEGATSWWEGYDLGWPKDNFHANLQADNGTGYFVSLCHGWSAGPTNWLTERVLGVKSTGGGFRTCTIQPNLGDLKWASGTIPTPHGPIKLRVEKVASEYSVKVTVPSGVEASVGSETLTAGSHVIKIPAQTDAQ